MSDLPPPAPTVPVDYNRKMAMGSGWMIAMRWSTRGLGFISTIILARLLTPNDFGLVAKAMLVIGMLEILAETGQRLAIIRHPHPLREHYDTAWTIGILVNSTLALGMFLSAPIVQSLFNEPAAEPLVRILALRTLLNGFENIGTVNFRRDLNFRQDFRYNILTKICSFFITIGLALFLKNYFALVGGIVLGQLALVIISYVVSNYRPRFSLAAARELWGFSAWTLVSSSGLYVLARLDQWVLSPQVSNSLMGQYSVGSELAQLPASEVIAPASRALYPAYSRLWSKSLSTMSDALFTNLRFIAIACASTGIGIASISYDFALVILGPQWTETAQFMSYLAISGAINAFNSSAAVVLNVTGHVRSAGVLAWIRVLIAIPCLLVGFHWNGPLGVAQALLLAEILFTPTVYYQIRKAVPITIPLLGDIVWRPILAGLVMALALSLFPQTPYLAPVLRLLLEIALGAAIFILSLFSLWWLSGRPIGGETILVSQIKKSIGLL